ncbi:MAG: hypothetical protein E6K98_04430 [Thaumarchaeota archaeon]|nr:MAG: hypothetical protein E6K98_04430 [Nitrososphaerota archaeon]TLX94053.1 MAG: hypothetical protein E6K91_07565 [Nitrososphaerota archaeon]
MLDSYSQTFLSTNQERSDKQRENFKIATVALQGNKFNITVQNTGDIPINITRLWAQDKSVTDSFGTYTINTNVSPGGVATNIGQSIALNPVPTDSYSVKLVTSRGNSQQFSMNSVSTAPLYLQFIAIPSTVPSGVASELVLILTNNGSSTLVNVVPATPQPIAGSASYKPLGSSTPPSYATLPPGQTAIFTWNLVESGKDGDYRKFSASLQNGFPGNSASATVTVRDLTAASSNWSTTWGILSINYTTLQWSRDNGVTWNNAWSVPAQTSIVWRVNITNNDPVRSFILNGNTTLVAFGASPGNNAALPFYILKNNYPPATQYPTNGQTIPSNSTQRIVFGAFGAGSMPPVSFSNAQKGQYAISILIFGYWNSPSSGNFFGQNIPYEGIIVT